MKNKTNLKLIITNKYEGNLNKTRTKKTKEKI